MEDTELLIKGLFSTDPRRAIKCARALGDLQKYDAKPHLVKLLGQAKSWDVRNAAAIGLMDLGASEAVPVIRQYISKRNNWEQCGTLVYALQNMDCMPAATELIELIKHGPYESREMALQALESVSAPIGEETASRLIDSLKAHLKRHVCATDDEVTKYVEHAILVLSDLAVL